MHSNVEARHRCISVLPWLAKVKHLSQVKDQWRVETHTEQGSRWFKTLPQIASSVKPSTKTITVPNVAASAFRNGLCPGWMHKAQFEAENKDIWNDVMWSDCSDHLLLETTTNRQCLHATIRHGGGLLMAAMRGPEEQVRVYKLITHAIAVFQGDTHHSTYRCFTSAVELFHSLPSRQIRHHLNVKCWNAFPPWLLLKNTMLSYPWKVHYPILKFPHHTCACLILEQDWLPGYLRCLKSCSQAHPLKWDFQLAQGKLTLSAANVKTALCQRMHHSAQWSSNIQLQAQEDKHFWQEWDFNSSWKAVFHCCFWLKVSSLLHIWPHQWWVCCAWVWSGEMTVAPVTTPKSNVTIYRHTLVYTSTLLQEVEKHWTKQKQDLQL